MERNKVISEKADAGLLTPEEQKELIEMFASVMVECVFLK
jgi:hypothetical protein